LEITDFSLRPIFKLSLICTYDVSTRGRGTEVARGDGGILKRLTGGGGINACICSQIISQQCACVQVLKTGENPNMISSSEPAFLSASAKGT
jgi:hypothetical protein